ncbi:hypothetical protein I317_06501 [Kwoniella heveanensis CBS 569]|nr:hypothetical protein I317_06501 [Kwoniella heveanensis CBS 569]
MIQTSDLDNKDFKSTLSKEDVELEHSTAGIPSLSSASNLPTYAQPVGFDARFCSFEGPRTLLMDTSRMNFISGHYNLMDEVERILLKSDGKIGHGKSYTDESGAEVLHTSTGIGNRKTVGKLPDGREIFWVKPDNWGGYQFAAEFIDCTTQARRNIMMKGNWREKSEIYIDDRIIGRVTKEKFWSSKRRLEVAGNVDILLVFACAICFKVLCDDTQANIAAVS